MRILAIETSGQRGSLATLCGEPDVLRTVRQTMLTEDTRTAQSLAPALQSLLADSGWSPDSIEVVAVAVGPGSFTGLRIGVTTAKTFAYAVSAEIVGVNTLTVLAQQVPPSPTSLWAIMDAQRGELFAARFDSTDGVALTIARETSVVTQDAWLAALQSGDRVTGPALRRVLPRLPNDIAIVPEEYWQPMGEAVGQAGWQAYRAGHRDDIWKLVPHYYRVSAAEEKAQQRHQTQ
ncbi:MAG: tRNA (adenosine(37)-N6)-threonylcarbamoyltransferase complex dimerization subunit type 1 TsaB [Pirellulales bacterium]